jgi:PAS domain S-box-containing protein
MAIDTADAGVWEWNLEADEVVWHESCERLFGLEPGAFEGTYEAFADRVHPADRSTLEAAIERTLAHGDTFQATYRIVRDDGETRWLDGRGEMFFDDAGRPERLLGVALDVTEQKERERDLEQYETIIETADDPIYALDAEGTITLANEGFTAAVGRSKDDLIGTNITAVLDPEDVEASLEHIRTLAEGEKEPGTVDLTLDGANGTRQFEVDISLVEDDETGTSQETGADRVPGTVGVARDVTELRDRLQQLQVLDRVLRHNLRNDMTVIRGNAETIEQTASEPVSTYADRIVTYSDKLIGLTEKQREITRVLAAEPSRTTEDAVAVCRQIVDSLSAVHPDTEFVLDVPERAPVVATENLQRAIEELVTNAIEHSDRDRPRVGVTVDVADETVDISVTDDGPGIPAMERDIVTGKHDIDPLFHGRGLGLWLVSRIVRRSNGTLSFAESERRGTTVTISLPLATSDAKTDVEQ